MNDQLVVFALAYEFAGRRGVFVPCDPVVDAKEIAGYEAAADAGEIEILYKGSSEEIARATLTAHQLFPPSGLDLTTTNPIGFTGDSLSARCDQQPSDQHQ